MILLVENASDTFENGFQRFQMVKEWSTYKEDLFVAFIHPNMRTKKRNDYRLNDHDFESAGIGSKMGSLVNEVQQWITAAVKKEEMKRKQNRLVET